MTVRCNCLLGGWHNASIGLTALRLFRFNDYLQIRTSVGAPTSPMLNVNARRQPAARTMPVEKGFTGASIVRGPRVNNRLLCAREIRQFAGCARLEVILAKANML